MIVLRLGSTVALILFLSLGGILGNSQTSSQTPEPEPLHGQQYVEPFRIIGNIHYVGFSNSTSYLITTPEGHILLDPTFESAVPQIRENIQQLGFKAEDVKMVLNAHAHRDHVEGLAAMKKLTGAQVLAMEGDAAVIADGGVSDFRSDGQQLWTPLQADRILQDGEEVRLGDLVMVAHRTAGHTRGCTTWTTTVEDAGRNLQVVFVCSLGLNRGVSLIGNTVYPEIAEDYYNSFERMKRLPCDVFLGSHASFFGLIEKMQRLQQGADPNPFIDPDGYREYLDSSEIAYKNQL